MTPAEMLDAAMDGTLELDSSQQAAVAPTTAETAATDNAEQAPDAHADDEPQGAPIASKSGAYTIPYDKLVQARGRAHALAGENEALKAQLAELSARQQANLHEQQAAAHGREAAGQSATTADRNLEVAQDAIEQGVDVSLFGDFSEEALAKGIQTLSVQMAHSIRQELRSEMARDLEPIRQQREQGEVQNHYGAIYDSHPDADELAQSEQFSRWAQALPSVMRDGVVFAMQEGTTAQVIEVFDAFKAQHGGKPANAGLTQSQSQAQAAPEVQRRVPNSLSEIAGTPHRDVVQQTLETAGNPAALMEAMESMTPAQIERLMTAV